MTPEFQVAVILVNYNSSQFTLDCIQSIFHHTGAIRYQIIVIDNNSRPEDFAKISMIKDPRVFVHRSRLNVGFSGANMMGVQLADAEYYYFLNNDTVLLNDCFSILYAFMEKNPVIGNCSGEMFGGDGKFECGFGFFPSIALKIFGSGLLRRFSPSAFPRRNHPLTAPTKVDFVSGSSMFIRRKPFDECGGLDTHYFLYNEEEDIALTLRRHGWPTFVVPEARYQHFMNKSTESASAIRLPFRKEYFISLFYYFRKHYGFFYLKTMQVIFFFKTIRKFYRTFDYVRLAWFILRGAPVRESLRFKQRIAE